MPEVVMRVGRICPVCKRDGTDGQSTVQVMNTGENQVGCPECGTTWKDGETHKPKPIPAPAKK